MVYNDYMNKICEKCRHLNHDNSKNDGYCVIPLETSLITGKINVWCGCYVDQPYKPH